MMHSPYEWWNHKIDAHSPTFDAVGNKIVPNRRCYCEIGAGGNPCRSREYCDGFRAGRKDWWSLAAYLQKLAKITPHKWLKEEINDLLNKK